jgi:hypothetical protein
MSQDEFLSSDMIPASEEGHIDLGFLGEVMSQPPE